jgi:hypothetical protein
MQRLLAMAATTAALGACAKEGAPEVKKEDPSTLKKKPPTDDTATVKSAEVVDTGPPPEPPTGYAVVDPMPPPAACPGTAASVKATATWKTDKGTTYVELTLKKPTVVGAMFDRKDSPTGYGGKIVSTAFVGDDLVLKLVPEGTSPSMAVYVAADCAKGKEHVVIEVDMSKPKAGTTATTTLSDQY